MKRTIEETIAKCLTEELKGHPLAELVQVNAKLARITDTHFLTPSEQKKLQLRLAMSSGKIGAVTTGAKARSYAKDLLQRILLVACRCMKAPDVATADLTHGNGDLHIQAISLGGVQNEWSAYVQEPHQKPWKPVLNHNQVCIPLNVEYGKVLA